MAERDIGLVLDGGGGKGAYQLGVWRALRETGLDQRIAQISGASVGALNAALMVQGDLDSAVKIWLQELEKLHPTRIQMWVEDIIARYLDLSAFSASEIDCWIAATCITPEMQRLQCVEWNPSGTVARKYRIGKAHYFNMRGCTEQERQLLLRETVLLKSIMLATCALPLICHSKKIDGLRYRDGGLRDNSPLCPITDVPYMQRGSRRCKYIIVVHLAPVKYNHDPELMQDIPLLQITPKKELGGLLKGTLNFSTAHAEMLAEAGYAESLPLFKALLLNEQRTQDAKELSKRKAPLKNSTLQANQKQLDIIAEFRKRGLIP